MNLNTPIAEIKNFSIVDMMILSQKMELSKNATIDKNELARLMGKSIRRVNALLKNKIFPENMIVGGYQQKKQKEKTMFFTLETLLWLKG